MKDIINKTLLLTDREFSENPKRLFVITCIAGISLAMILAYLLWF